MQIFYAKTEDLIHSIGLKELERFSDKNDYGSKSKYLQHLCGLYIVHHIAQKVFNINNTEIILKKKKPVFKHSKLNFSISHSQNLVAVGFSRHNVGLDIEYMKERDFKTLARRYKLRYDDKKYFYTFWTRLEASIKLGTNNKSSYTSIIEDEYMLTCLSDDIMVNDFKIKKL